MPIYVNMPGGGLASVGQGLAASQGFRANEQRIAAGGRVRRAWPRA